MDTSLYPQLYTCDVAELDKAQFRTDPKFIRAVRERGLNPNDFARQVFEQEARKILADDWLARLRELQKKMKPWKPEEMARAVREARDEH